MIKFSICIPNFNYGSYIGETIESVLNQSYPNFEIVIVDNASTDNSWEVIHSYALKDHRIKAFKNSYNVGFAPNLDKAASKASNEFILMLSSDDTMKPNALAIYSEILKSIAKDKYNSLLICSATDVIDGNSEIKETLFRNRFHNVKPIANYKLNSNNENIQLFSGLDIMRDIFLRFSVPGPFNSTLFSKELYERVGGYASVNLIGPDAHFAYKCLLTGVDVLFYNFPLFNYRIHRSGQLKLSSKNKNINVLIDRYIFSNAYSDSQLKMCGLSRELFKKATLEVDCIKGSYNSLAEGEWVYATQHLFFALSAYPNLTWRNRHTYLIILLLLTGPLGVVTMRFLHRFRMKSIQSKSNTTVLNS